MAFALLPGAVGSLTNATSVGRARRSHDRLRVVMTPEETGSSWGTRISQLGGRMTVVPHRVTVQPAVFDGTFTLVRPMSSAQHDLTRSSSDTWSWHVTSSHGHSKATLLASADRAVADVSTPFRGVSTPISLWSSVVSAGSARQCTLLASRCSLHRSYRIPFTPHSASSPLSSLRQPTTYRRTASDRRGRRALAASQARLFGPSKRVHGLRDPSDRYLSLRWEMGGARTP
jgi:hypothetical protein